MNSVYLRTHIIDMEEKFENIKEVIRIHIWKKKQTTQCPKEKEEKDKQRSTTHTH